VNFYYIEYLLRENIVKTIRLFATICVLLAAHFAQVETAAACSERVPEWWFSEQLEVEVNQTTRPAGLAIKTMTLNDRASIFVGNNTGSRMYLVSHSNLPTNPIEGISKLPSGYTAFELLRGGQSSVLEMKKLQNLLPGMTDYNSNASERPSDIETPALQYSEIFVFFEEELLSFPVTLDYSLNSEYEPTNGLGGCGSIIFLLPILFVTSNPLICLIPILLIVGYNFVSVYKKQPKSSTP
jgi:hypothetical protein